MWIREATTDDGSILLDMLLEAFTWNGEQRLTRTQLLSDRHAARYLDGWMRPGDFGFVALDAAADDDLVLGAIWARPLPAVAAGYGYVADDVPEVSMAVVAHARGRGVGGALLSACLHAGRMLGWRALSLSVEDGNSAARRLYERHGFRRVGRNGGADTMVVDLSAA